MSDARLGRWLVRLVFMVAVSVVVVGISPGKPPCSSASQGRRGGTGRPGIPGLRASRRCCATSRTGSASMRTGCAPVVRCGVRVVGVGGSRGTRTHNLRIKSPQLCH